MESGRDGTTPFVRRVSDHFTAEGIPTLPSFLRQTNHALCNITKQKTTDYVN